MSANGNTSSATIGSLLDSCEIAVVGGGVVGCALARRLTLEGADVVLLEKAPDILDGASKANSAILHTGFDAPPGSLEHALMVRGREEYLAVHESLNLPLLRTGALVAAWTEEEAARLEDILERAHGNGTEDARLLTASQAREIEPGLAEGLVAAVHVPGEYLVDPWSAPLAYLLQAMANGARVWTNAAVTGGEYDGDGWLLHTPKGKVRAGHVVNCAGLYGDVLEEALLGEAGFVIRPRKGQFVVFDKAASRHLKTIILPVPTERTKGIVVCPTIFGNVLVGPTAEDQESRDSAPVDEETLRALVHHAAQVVPALRDMPVTAVYAGLRPATERKEYRLRHRPERHWTTVGGIRSTGLTAALGIAAHVAELLAESGHPFRPLKNPRTPQVPNLAQHRPRDWTRPGYGEIVCHCELVTRREIEAALESPLPPGSMAGLKRRTRATMGRCQGFYCSARLAELTEGRFETGLAAGKATGKGHE